jgi:hypothetical protein
MPDTSFPIINSDQDGTILIVVCILKWVTKKVGLEAKATLIEV